MTVALGFATAENIEYVFSTPYGTGLSSNEVFMSELFVLITRLLLPIHVICSVIQAANLSRVVLGMKQMSTFWVLFPAILLHGSFDFYLFAVSTVAFVYQIDDTNILVAAILGPILITVVGVGYAYIDFTKVVTEYDAAWRLHPQAFTPPNPPSSHQGAPSRTPQATVVQSPMMAEAYIV
jgi:RsiW-degrading membrane proteinase PrsW (M82 family)